ncbi:hypothetical protein SNARM312S_08285 [Streptomyces narbonensis]
MSAIWSASSRTVIATWSRRQSPRSMRSMRRPGVAMRTSAPRRSAEDCREIDMPPTTVVIRRRRAPAYGVRASVTCWASSRVGTRTSARGAVGSARRPAVRARSARPKARVLPEPVRPRPRTSRPAREFGRVAAWIGNGSVTPCSPRIRRRPSGMSRSEKEATAGSAGVTVSGGVNSAGGGGAVGRRPPREAFGCDVDFAGAVRGPRLWGRSERVMRAFLAGARGTAGARTCAMRAPAVRSGTRERAPAASPGTRDTHSGCLYRNNSAPQDLPAPPDRCPDGSAQARTPLRGRPHSRHARTATPSSTMVRYWRAISSGRCCPPGRYQDAATQTVSRTKR